MFVQFLAPPSHLKSGMPCPRRPGQLLLESLPKDTSQEPFCDAGPLPVLMDAPSQLTGNSVRQSVETKQQKAVPTAAQCDESVSHPHHPHQPPRFPTVLHQKTKGVESQLLVLHCWNEEGGLGHSPVPILCLQEFPKAAGCPKVLVVLRASSVLPSLAPRTSIDISGELLTVHPHVYKLFLE